MYFWGLGFCLFALFLFLSKVDSGTLVQRAGPQVWAPAAQKSITHYVHGLSTVSQEQTSPCRNTPLQRSKAPRGSGKTLIRWFKKSWLFSHLPTSYVISKRKKHYKELAWLLIPLWVLSALALWARYFEPQRWREHRKGGRDSKWTSGTLPWETKTQQSTCHLALALVMNRLMRTFLKFPVINKLPHVHKYTSIPTFYFLKLFLTKYFHAMYFDHISPLPTPSRSFPPPYPTNFISVVSLSLRIIKQTRKQKKDKTSKRQKKRPKLNNIYKRNKQKTRNLYMLAPGHSACPGEWLTHPVTMEWRKPIFPLQEVSTADSVSVTGGTPCPLPCTGAVL